MPRRSYGLTLNFNLEFRPKIKSKSKIMIKSTDSTVDDQLDILRQPPRDLIDDVALEQAGHGEPVRGAEHEEIDAQRRGEIEDGRRRDWC